LGVGVNRLGRGAPEDRSRAARALHQRGGLQGAGREIHVLVDLGAARRVEVALLPHARPRARAAEHLDDGGHDLTGHASLNQAAEGQLRQEQQQRGDVCGGGEAAGVL